MSEHVYKVVEVVGSSKEGIEDAIKNAVSRTAKTIRNLRWFEITQIRGQVSREDVTFWQVALKIGFNVETNKSVSQTDTGDSGEKIIQSASSKFRCKVCGYIYDPEKGDPNGGIKPGIPFEELPDDWICPECGVNKDQFELLG